MYAFEAPYYTNRLGMDEHMEDKFIHSQIDKFCEAVLRYKQHNQDLYEIIYDYIRDNIEKFIPEPDYDEYI